MTADTSVVVAGLSAWHEQHRAARAALPELDWLPAHVLLESVSTLSRMPRGLAQPLGVACQAAGRLAGGRLRVLSPEGYPPVLDVLSRAGLSGGAVYDGLVAATAAEHGATLLSLDRRAAATYRAVGVRHALLG